MVVSGVIKSGTATLNKPVLLGPDKWKKFKQVQIKSIHVNRVLVDQAVSGSFACFHINTKKLSEKITRADFRKGMVLLDSNLKTEPAMEFEAEIDVL